MSGPGTAQIVVELDRDGLIVHGQGGEFGRVLEDSVSVASLPSPLRDSLTALIERARTAVPGTVVAGAAGTRTLLASRLAHPAWVVVTLIEREAIVAPLLGSLRVIRATLVIVFIALLLAMIGAVSADLRRARAVEMRRDAEFVAVLNETTVDLLERRDRADLLQPSPRVSPH